MNSWLIFLRDFYRSEKSLHNKCSNSGSIKRAAKIYKCKKNLANTKKKNTDSFHEINPMHIKTRKNKKK